MMNTDQTVLDLEEPKVPPKGLFTVAFSTRHQTAYDVTDLLDHILHHRWGKDLVKVIAVVHSDPEPTKNGLQSISLVNGEDVFIPLTQEWQWNDLSSPMLVLRNGILTIVEE